MKLETPFTGKLAVLGERGRDGHLLALDGTWTLREEAPVTHETMLSTTVIGEIKRIAVVPLEDGSAVLQAFGHGTEWLADLLDAGQLALSLELRDMTTSSGHYFGQLDVLAGRVHGARAVHASKFGWRK